jgi:hypothetical protein
MYLFGASRGGFKRPKAVVQKNALIMRKRNIDIENKRGAIRKSKPRPQQTTERSRRKRQSAFCFHKCGHKCQTTFE